MLTLPSISEKNNWILISILLTVLFLPNIEAPKNIMILVFVFLWGIFSYRKGDFGGDWNKSDGIFLSIIIVNIIVALNANFIHEQPMKGANDILRIFIFGWIITRIRFSSEDIYLLVFVSAFSILTILSNFITCPKLGSCIQLNSVGHVNHTAIYLIIALSFSLPLFVDKYKKLPIWFRLSGLVYFIFIFSMVIATQSRAATGAVFLLLLITFVYLLFRKEFVKLKGLGIILLITIVFGAINPPKVMDKFIYGSAIIGDSPRQKIRNFSYEIFKLDPFLGTGMNNFPNFEMEDIKNQVIEEKGVKWWQENSSLVYAPYAHPHSLYYTYLTGGGILFLSVLMFFWTRVSIEIIKNFKNEDHWLNVSTLSVVLVNLLVGIVNSTFAHEHGLLSILIIGVFLSRRRYGG